jgi:ADP-ribosylglycohydrolase
LSTSRATRSDGYFDVGSFAKIELPVWLNYALGAGRGSKAAATNLALRDSTWSQNFFNSGNIKYWECGGNGAAMRIQPHVWKSHRSESKKFLSDVVRDSVCTHGHPRGIIGAAIHAQFVFLTMRSGKLPAPDSWVEVGKIAAAGAFDAMNSDEELALVWIPSWEQYAGRPLEDVWAQTVDEWVEAAGIAARSCSAAAKSREDVYRTMLNNLGGFSPSERGSGLKTPLYGTAVAWLFRDSAPESALLAAANTFGSDTDTIATMAGALIGLVAETSPPASIQDQSYIELEAERLYAIGAGERPGSFSYPDLLTWGGLRSQSEAWVVEGDAQTLLGLGRLEPFGDTFPARKGTDLLWQWCSLSFGQTILAKRKASGPSESKQMKSPTTDAKRVTSSAEPSAISEHRQDKSVQKIISLDDATQECIKSDFDPEVIGRNLLALSVGEDGIERAIAFAAIVSKARIARTRRR